MAFDNFGRKILGIPGIVRNALTPEHKKIVPAESTPDEVQAKEDERCLKAVEDWNSTNRGTHSFNGHSPCPNKAVKQIQTHRHVEAEVIAQPKNLLDALMHESEFQHLVSRLDTAAWPQAVVTQASFIDTDDGRRSRAESIMKKYFSDGSLQGKTFLDIGCGRGDTLRYSKDKYGASYSTGYDPYVPLHKENAGTHAWVHNKIKGLFDVILIHDVMDHLIDSTPTELLNTAKRHLNPGGVIHLFCHPWVSRSGGHLYTQKNKAYLHLIFSPPELRRMGIQEFPNISRLVNPLTVYNDAISASGLQKFMQRDMKVVPIEPFFHNDPVIARRFLNVFLSQNRDAEVHHVHYKLKHLG